MYIHADACYYKYAHISVRVFVVQRPHVPVEIMRSHCFILDLVTYTCVLGIKERTILYCGMHNRNITENLR